MTRKEFLEKFNRLMGWSYIYYSCMAVENFISFEARRVYNIFFNSRNDCAYWLNADRTINDDWEHLTIEDMRVMLLLNFREHVLANKLYKEF